MLIFPGSHTDIPSKLQGYGDSKRSTSLNAPPYGFPNDVRIFWTSSSATEAQVMHTHPMRSHTEISRRLHGHSGQAPGRRTLKAYPRASKLKEYRYRKEAIRILCASYWASNAQSYPQAFYSQSYAYLKQAVRILYVTQRLKAIHRHSPMRSHTDISI